MLLLGRQRSLRTAVAIVAVIAFAALGVAVWALLHDNGGGTRRQGVSVASVRLLENRVQRLEQRVPSQQDIASLREDVQAIAKRLAAATAAQRRADTLDQRLQEDRHQLRDLKQRVDAVERAQAQSGAPR